MLQNLNKPAITHSRPLLTLHLNHSGVQSQNFCSLSKLPSFFFFNGSILNHPEVRLKRKKLPLLNISGDWLEVNRALNPAKLWQGQYGRGTMAWPGISEPLFSA